jgi:tetratricopeptide (TPR) repeat protein
MPRSILLLLFVLAVSAWPLHAQAPPQSTDLQTAERMFVHGVEMQQSGDYIGAIDAYKTVLGLDPKRVDVLSNLGACYVRIGQYADGIAQYQAALVIDPANVLVHMNLALAYYKSGRPREAIEPLQFVVAAPQAPKNAFLLLGDCYLQTGRAKDTVDLLLPRDALFTDDRAFAYVLGMALIRSDREQEGLPYIDRIFAGGDSAEAHLLLGLAHLNRMDFSPARVEFEKAMKLNPSLPTLNSAYGRTLLAMSDRKSAEQALLREISINPNDFDANLTLGSLRRSVQDFDNAIIYLNRALAIHPGDLNARKVLATLKLQTGAVEEAKDLLEGIVKDAPDVVEGHVQLATAYNRLKRKDDAARERAIVDRLNAANQEKEGKEHPADGAGGDTPAPSAPPAPGTQEGPQR